jgi:hypothetical protein
MVFVSSAFEFEKARENTGGRRGGRERRERVRSIEK